MRIGLQDQDQAGQGLGFFEPLGGILRTFGRAQVEGAVQAVQMQAISPKSVFQETGHLGRKSRLGVHPEHCHLLIGRERQPRCILASDRARWHA